MLRPLLAGTLASSLLLAGSCGSRASEITLDELEIGVRRGEQDAVDPTDEITVDSRVDLGAALAVHGDSGWVSATWTVWGPHGPRTVATHMFNKGGPTTLFTGLDGDTEAGGWQEGAITCDMKTAAGQTRIGTIRVVRR